MEINFMLLTVKDLNSLEVENKNNKHLYHTSLIQGTLGDAEAKAPVLQAGKEDRGEWHRAHLCWPHL